jgi:hypothetical protein
MVKRKIYWKKIGSSRKGNTEIMATTWDGRNKVKIITPKKPTPRQKRLTRDFLLNELDDHKAYNSYNNKIKRR